ncbi:MAG: biotin/lipoyl-binding protein [Sulfolobales archaeon]|nr:biotin/lipoyl-binding protein [Sulfolobales archaeon]
MSKSYNLRVNDKEYSVEVSELGGGKFKVKVGNKELVVEFIQRRVAVQTPTIAEEQLVKEVKTAAPQTPATLSEGAEVVTAPVPGKVIKVLVSSGDMVKEKSVLLTLESMKMELEITSSTAGVVKEVKVKPGDSVNVGDLLVVIGRV